jgi:hypothetical protein
MAFGDTQTLTAWLADRTAQAAIVQPDPDHPGEIWLIIGPRAVPEDIARSLAVLRTGAEGPGGQVALFPSGHDWESWTAPDRALRLQDRPNLANLRDILGNYATHRPLGFLAVIFSLTALSAAVGLVVLLITRERRT